MRIKVKRYIKQRVKVLLSVVLALMMVLSMLPYMSLVVRAANSVSYINADGTTSTHDCTVIDKNFIIFSLLQDRIFAIKLFVSLFHFAG